MRKYPVTSKSGVEYEVRVEERLNFDYEEIIAISLLVCSKGLFGRVKKKHLCNHTITEKEFLESYDRNYIKLIKSVVESGEKAYYKPMKEFKEWNGKC